MAGSTVIRVTRLPLSFGRCILVPMITDPVHTYSRNRSADPSVRDYGLQKKVLNLQWHSWYK